MHVVFTFKCNFNEVSVFVILSSFNEHYYDGESGTGYFAWRFKTIQRGTAKDRRSSFGGNTGKCMEQNSR